MLRKLLSLLLAPCLVGVPCLTHAATEALSARGQNRSLFAEQALAPTAAGERLPTVSSEARRVLIAGAAYAWFADRYEDLADRLRYIFLRRFKADPISWERTISVEQLADHNHLFSFLEDVMRDPHFFEGLTKHRLLGLAQSGLNPTGPHGAGLREDIKRAFHAYALDQSISSADLQAVLAKLTPGHQAADFRELTKDQGDIHLFDCHLQLVRRSEAPREWKPFLPDEMDDPEYLVLVPRKIRLAKRYAGGEEYAPQAARTPIAFLQLKRLGNRWVVTGYDFPAYTFLTSPMRRHLRSWASILLFALEDIARREGASELWVPASSFFENKFFATKALWIWGSFAYSPTAGSSLRHRFQQLYNTIPKWRGFEELPDSRFPTPKGPERITRDFRQVLRHRHFFFKRLGSVDETLRRFQQICLQQQSA